MNKSIILATSKLFKILIFLSLGIYTLQGCSEDPEPTPLPLTSVDSVYTITNVVNTSNTIKVKAILNKKSQVIVKTAIFEYSFSPDFKDVKSFRFDNVKQGSLDSIGFETGPLFFKQTIYARLYTYQHNANGAVGSIYSQTKEYSANTFPSVKGAKFVIGYNDSLFTIDTDGSNFKFLSIGRNIGRNGKIIQLGNCKLQDTKSYEIIRDSLKYDDLRICDFTLDGSKLIASRSGERSSMLIKNGGVIRILGKDYWNKGNELMHNFSYDESKVLYEDGEYFNFHIYDLNNSNDIVIGTFTCGMLNKSNTKIALTSGVYKTDPPYYMNGSLLICDPVKDGSSNATTLILYDYKDVNRRLATTHPIFSEDESIIYFIVEKYTAVPESTNSDIYSIPITGGTPTKITNYNFNFFNTKTKVLFKLVNFE